MISFSSVMTAGRVVRSCLKIYHSWVTRAKETERVELEKIIAELQSGKSLERRMGEQLATSLHSLRLPQKTLDALCLLEGDDLFHAEVAKKLSSGPISSSQLADIVGSAIAMQSVPQNEVKSIAAFWLDAIHMGVGTSPALAHALQIKSSYRLEETLSDVVVATQDITSKVLKIQDTQELGIEISLENSAKIANIERILQDFGADSAPGQMSAQSILQKQFQTRFDKCRKSLSTGSINTAEQEFSSLIDDLIEAKEHGDKDLLFRCHLNHSSCLLLLERNQAAKEALERAKNILPNDNRFHRHHATLLSWSGDVLGALNITQILRKLEPNECKHIANEISFLDALKRDEELIHLLRSIDSEDADVQCSKALAFSRLGRRDEAINAAQSSLKLEPEAEGPWIALAYAIGFPVVERMPSRSRPRLSLTEEEYGLLDQAISASLKATEILKKRERLSILVEVQGNLLAFYIVAGREEEALELAKGMDISPNAPEVALNNLYQLFLHNDEASKAVKVADALVLKLGTHEMRLKRSNAYVLAGQGRIALDELEDIKIADKTVSELPAWIAIAANAHYDLHNADKAIGILQEGLKKYPDSLQLHLEIAQLFDDLHKEESALKHFLAAEKLSPQDPEIVSCAGQFLYFKGDWNGAIDRFKKIGAESPLNPMFPRLVAALYQVGKIDECLELVDLWKFKRSDVDVTVFRVGARAAMMAGNWPLAKEMLERLVRQRNGQLMDSYKLLAKVYLRIDDRQEAYTLLSQAMAAGELDSEGLTLLGNVSSACGKYSEALASHVQAVEKDPESLEARSGFFGTMLALPEEFTPEPQIIQLHYSNIEVLASHPSGILRTVRMERDDGEIDITALKKELGKNAEVVSDFLKYSQENPLPLKILASNLGVGMYDAWRGFSSDPQRGIWMCSGTKEEQEAQAIAVKESSDVSIDLVALMTLQGIGILDSVAKMFKRIFVHISIMDSVVNELRTARELRSSGKISSVNGNLVMSYPQPEEKLQKIEALSQICNFIKSDKVILSGLRCATKFSSFLHGLNVDDLNENSPFENLMKPALVAYERDAALLSDDFVTRMLSSKVGRPSFCTQALLRRALNEKIISKMAYEEAILMLHSWNYHFVSDNTDTLVRLIERDGKNVSDVGRRIFSKLAKTSIDSKESRRVLLDILVYIWKKSLEDAETARGWMAIIWKRIENADPKMELAFQVISDSGRIFIDYPTLFTKFAEYVCNCRKGSVGNAHRISKHVAIVASQAAAAQTRKGNAQSGHAWKIQARRLRRLH